MNALLLHLLSALASLIIRRHRPYIIGVTGTVGKTTITTTIAMMLRQSLGQDMVAISPYHYNGEYGLPLAIMQAKSGGKNILLWIVAFGVGISQIFRKYPKYIVLEYGIDHPGEMSFLLDIAIPDIAIIAPIAPNHIEQFGTFEKYRHEKFLLAEHAKHVILHESHRGHMEKEALYYGSGAMSDIDCSHGEVTPQGTRATIHFFGQDIDIILPSVGLFQIENILPLFAVTHILGIDSTRIPQMTHLFQPEPGRSRLLRGRFQSTLIDGSYNGGFESIKKGILSLLPFLGKHHLVICLGDMRELGDLTQSLHEDLASFLFDQFHEHIDQVHFFLVGESMEKYVFSYLCENGFLVEKTRNSRTFGSPILNILEHFPYSVVYVKGSQNTLFLEEVVSQLLEVPSDVSFLCRQSREWKKKKQAYFDSL